MGRQSKYTLLIICEGKIQNPISLIPSGIVFSKANILMNEDVEVHIRPEVEDVRDVEPRMSNISRKGIQGRCYFEIDQLKRTSQVFLL